MKILLVADGRSPITRNWLTMLRQLPDVQISLASTYPCDPIEGLAQQAIIPVAFSQAAGTQAGNPLRSNQSIFHFIRRARRQLFALRAYLGPSTLPKAGKKFLAFFESINPDIVHALRIPYEGMLASYTPKETPLVVSIWGNDLTLHTRTSGSMRAWTRQTLIRADGLLADAERDIKLSEKWGFRPQLPTLVVPGSGGINLDEMQQAAQAADVEQYLSEKPFHIINPRGLRPGYVNSAAFFAAAQLVAEAQPDVMFLCPGMQGQEEALDYVKHHKLADHVKLLPTLTQGQLWKLFQHAQVSASISTHDGTPNTLLEAMAMGSFPVAGDLDSLRFWIQDQQNGLLVNANDPQQIAASILLALGNAELRAKAAELNRQKILQYASRTSTAEKVSAFYRQVLS